MRVATAGIDDSATDDSTMEGFKIEEVDEAEDAMYQGGCRGSCLSDKDLEE